MMNRDRHSKSQLLTLMPQVMLQALQALGYSLVFAFACATSTSAAERIILQYGVLEFSLSTSDLQNYATEGVISNELAAYLKRIDPKQTWLRKLLTTPYRTGNQQTLIQIDRQLNSAEGEALLNLFGEVIQTDARSDGAKAIRSAITLAASQSSQFTVLDILHHFPTQKIRVEIAKIPDLLSKLKRLGQLVASLRRSQISSGLVSGIPKFVDSLAQLPISEKAQKNEADLIIRQVFLEWLLHDLNIEDEVIPKFEASLRIRQANGDRQGEGLILLALGWYYTYIGQPHEAIKRTKLALNIFEHQVDFDAGKALTLTSLGFAYLQLGVHETAQKYFEQALKIHQVAKSDRPRLSAEDFIQAFYKVAIFDFAPPQIAQLLHDYAGEGILYQCLGAVHERQKKSALAEKYYKQALAIHQESGFLDLEQWQLSYLVGYHTRLGQYSEALQYVETSQKLEKERRASSGITIQISGRAKPSLNTALYNDAISHYLVAIYFKLNKYKELEAYLKQELDNLSGSYQAPSKRRLGYIYEDLGWLYTRQRNYLKAIEYHRKALLEYQTLQDSVEAARALANLAYTFQSQSESELAIVFYKQSINTYEAIRASNRDLSRDVQESYTQSIASTYRQLADLLLRQDRILEAQQVLDLLKVQELEDYLRNVRSNQQTAQGIEILRPEAEILKQYGALQSSAVKLGQELTQLRKISESQRTPQQQQRLAQLVKLEADLNQQFNQFIDDVAVQLQELSRTARRQNLNLEDLNALRDNLRQHNAALLYPLILDDRLELILTTPDAPPLRRTVSVRREDLNRAIVEFREMMEVGSSPKPVAQKLYQWLIQPIAAELKQAGVDTIIYAPDGQLRYIPLAALHDGNQWLVQRYQVNHITARSLTDFTPTPRSSRRLLAGAFVQGSYEFQIGGQRFAFTGLPYAGKEVDSLATTIPGTVKLIDQAFGREAVLPRLSDYTTIHFATHAAFITGQPEDSFIVFGNGDKVTLREIGNWSLQTVDLVVLSACETGLGGFGNGEEVLGLGYQFQRAGARAAIASLWAVNDNSTQELMAVFYKALNTPGVTKAAALRRAQLALIVGEEASLDRSRSIGVTTQPASPSRQTSSPFAHPYHWAPFILIGNGL
jgi:CHAT domain-containing protein/Tfp pilus assembly protein PilF